MNVPSAPKRGSPIGGNLGGVRADLEEEATLVGGLSSSQVLDLDRVRGNSPLVIEDFDLDEVRTSDLRTGRKAADHSQALQR